MQKTHISLNTWVGSSIYGSLYELTVDGCTVSVGFTEDPLPQLKHLVQLLERKETANEKDQ